MPVYTAVTANMNVDIYKFYNMVRVIRRNSLVSGRQIHLQEIYVFTMNSRSGRNTFILMNMNMATLRLTQFHKVHRE